MRCQYITAVVSIVFSLVIQSVNAQLIVESTGDVSIVKNLTIGSVSNSNAGMHMYKISQTSNQSYGILSHVLTQDTTPTGNLLALYGYADGWAIPNNAPNVRQILGVYGKAFASNSSTNRFTAGVAGVANGTHGVGVYGAITTNPYYTLPISWSTSSYAGYFAGDVRVTGTLTAAVVSTTSDYRLKKDIQDISRESVNNFMNLHPISYKFNIADTLNYTYLDTEKANQVRHFGLIAQEVQKIYPDLVYEIGNGFLSLNYTEFIPILIQMLQEQQKQIIELQKQIIELQTK